MVKLLFLVLLEFLLILRSPRPTSLAMALAVSLLKIGEAIGLAFLFGDWGGLSELFSREELEPKSLSCALSELLGLSSCKSASFCLKNKVK